MSARKISTANRLGAQSAFYFTGNVFTLLVGLPLQIYVARILGADGLGAFSLIEGGVSLLAGLIAFGLAPTLVKFIPAHLARGEHACTRKLIGHGALILLTAAALAYGLLLLMMPLATQSWPVLADHKSAVIVMGLLIPLSLITFYLQQGLRGFQEIRYMVLGSSFMQLTVKAVLAVLLLAMGFHLMGYVWAMVASMMFACVWMGVGLWKKISTLPRATNSQCAEQHKTAWRNYARIQYTGSLLGMGTQYLDRFLLGIFAGATPVGVLMVVKQLQQMPVIFLQMFLAVAAPMFSAAHARGDSTEQQHIYHLTTDWVVRLSAPLFIFFFLFAQPLLGLYGEDFARQGDYALWILLAAQTINLGFGPLGSVLNMCGMEGLMLKLSAYQTAITTVGIVLLVPQYGLLGAAFAIAAGLLFINCAALFAARKKLSMRWWDRRYLRWIVPLMASTAAGMLAHMLSPSQPGAALLALYLLTLYAIFHGVSLLQGLHKDDQELLHHLRAKLGLAKASAT